MTSPGKPSSLAEALAQLQGQLPRVAKEHTAEVRKDGKFSHKYAYADLTDVTEKIMPLLASLGLAFTCCPTVMEDSGRFVLDYQLKHVSGESMSGLYPLPTSGSPQDIGKAITYARRYALCAVTGLAPGGGDDDDAASAEAAHKAAAPAARQSRQVPDAELRGKGRMTRAEAAAHDKLKADTLREPKRAERSRPRAPDPDDPWAKDYAGMNGKELSAEAAAEDQPGSVAPGQHRAIEALLGRMSIGKDDRAERHAVIAHLLGLAELGSMTDLSYQQGADAIRLLTAELDAERMERLARADRT